MLSYIPGESRWLLREPDPRSQTLLFALPHPGCGGETYHRWPRRIGNWEICPVELRRDRGHGTGKRTGSYPLLAEGLVDVLYGYRGRSIGFFGHRAMALLGFEAAIKMAAIGGGEPLPVFVSAQPPPGKRISVARDTDAELAETMARVVLEIGGNPLPSLIESRVLNYRDDLMAAAEYQMARPVPAQLRVTTLSWAQDEELPPSRMDGWQDFGQVAAHVLSGNQYEFLSAPTALRRVLEAEAASCAGNIARRGR